MAIVLAIALLFFQPLFFQTTPAQSKQQPTRATEPGDPMPPPNMDYFLGSWSFEWNVPESPLGPPGKMKGKETYTKSPKDGSYESQIEGDGPLGRSRGTRQLFTMKKIAS